MLRALEPSCICFNQVRKRTDRLLLKKEVFTVRLHLATIIYANVIRYVYYSKSEVDISIPVE